MKISKINIKKFRTLENLVVEGNQIGLINELYGSNGSGKTSFISFISWMLYGETLDFGKDDEMNVDTFNPEENLSGEITLENDEDIVTLGREFGFDSKNSKINQFFINGRKVSKQDEYYKKVAECFGFGELANSLKIKGFNLNRALSDPYYLPNNEKQFRELISSLLNVDVIGDLLKQDKYSRIVEDFKKQGNDYDKCKEFYNQKIKETDENLVSTGIAIENGKKVSFNEEDLTNTLNEIDVLKTTNNYLVHKKFTHDKLEELNKISEELKESRIDDFENNPYNEKQTELYNKRLKLQNIINEKSQNLHAIENLDTKLNNVNSNLENAKKDYQKRIDYTNSQVAEKQLCPNCNLVLNEEEIKNFDKEKTERVNNLKKLIAEADEKIKSNSESYSKAVAPLNEKVKECADKIETLEKAINDLETELNDKPTNYVSDKTNSLETGYNVLKNECEELEKQFVEENQNKIQENNNMINELLLKVDQLKADKKVVEDLVIHKSNKKVLLANKADYELNLTLLKDLKSDEVNSIKNETTKIFGEDFAFEMLEKYKSSDNYKLVCHASVDGLEHSKFNTAKYLQYSLILLEKLKAFIGGSDIPVIFDIADNLGKTAREKMFNVVKDSQVFYTRIADEDGVEATLKVIK